MRGKGSFKQIDRVVGVPLVWSWGMLDRVTLKLRGIGHRPLAAGDRVLVAKMSALGDTLLLLPLLKALRQAVGPEGRIDFMATEVNRDALEGCPWIDEVLELELPRAFREPRFGWQFLKGMRSRQYTHALDMDQWVRFTPLACRLAGAERIYGFNTSSQHRHHLHLLSTSNGRGRHESVQFAEVAALAGLDLASVEPWPGFLARHPFGRGVFPPASSDRTSSKPVVVMHPGCGAHGWQRAWPEERWVTLAGRMKAQGLEVVLTGHGAFEEGLTSRIAAASGATNLAGTLDTPALVRLLSDASLVVCGNTGVMHLAAGLGRPLVALHGPTDPVKWGPMTGTVLSANLPCSPCLCLGFEYGCSGRACMEALDEDRVERACLEALRAGTSSEEAARVQAAASSAG